MRKKLAVALLGLSVFLMISGAALLFGRPAALPLPTVHTESTAYTSELVIAYDVEASAVDPLAIVGGILVLGGLMVSAAAVGRRLGQEASNAE